MSKRIIGYKKLMDAVSIAQAATAYTDSMRFERCTGTVGVLFKSTAGTVTITQQCSLDEKTWYDPVDAAASALGTVCTAKAVTTGTWTSYSPVMAPYIRFKVVETNTAATVVTVTLALQEEG